MGDVRRDQQGRHRRGQQDARRGPTVVVAVHDRPDAEEDSSAEHQGAADVEALAAAEGLRHGEPEQRPGDEGHRHVEPEDGLPADALDDGTADDRPERDTEAGDAAPDADGDGAHRTGTAAASRVSDSGMTAAAPRPWTARAVISAPEERLRAEAIDATVKRVRPPSITRRRPQRSPSVAAGSMNVAKASV